MTDIMWDKYENYVQLVALSETDLNDVIAIWNMWMNKKDLFLSITNSYDEVTIFYDETLVKNEELFATHRFRGRYVAYRGLNTGSFMEEAGLVSKLSTVFSSMGVPIMYITTYNNDYILVPVEFENITDSMINLTPKI
jgi:hypothetical protein